MLTIPHELTKVVLHIPSLPIRVFAQKIRCHHGRSFNLSITPPLHNSSHFIEKIRFILFQETDIKNHFNY